jgi:nitrite reductase/ring-hydroxylating ferredoxin subunit
VNDVWVRAIGVSSFKEANLLKVSVNGLSIAVGLVGSRAFAFDSKCPHKGGPLDQGELIGHVVRCPWHRYEFNVFSGEAVTIPYPVKYGAWRKTGNLRLYPTEIKQGEVYLDVPTPNHY